MPLLPAVVPLTTQKRSEVVPARLARNVAPLFGVTSPISPFGTMTWLSDFNRITITEIARGALSPTRSDRPEVPSGADWVVHGRAVVAAPGKSLPNEIINATTNRFGPHTKSAVLLTAVNTLLEPVALGMEEALPLLRAHDGGALPLALRIAAWSTAAIEVFRSQPALVVAAVKARRIQRESLDSPRFGRAAGLVNRAAARSEMGSRDVEKPDPVTHPRELFFVDRTVSCVDLPDLGPEPADDLLRPDADIRFRSTARDRHDELVERLITLLLDASEAEGGGYIWVSEREPDQFVAEALLPASGLVDSLCEYWLSVHGGGDASTATRVLLPSPERAAALSEQGRRVLVLAALGIVRYVRADIGSPGFTEADFLAMLDDIDGLAARCLDVNDPTSAVVRTRLDVLRVMVLRHNRTNPIAGLVRSLVAGVDRCLGMLAGGVLDRGATADVLGAACIELNAVRTTNATDRAAGLPTPVELDDLVRRYWRAYADTLEADLSAPGSAAAHGLGYHLHNYAAFLGSHERDADDLREAVRLFREFVIPSRWRLYRRIGVFGPLGLTSYVATASTSRLGELARSRHRPGEARAWAALGHEWIDPVLREHEAGRYQPVSDEQRGLFALRAAPALLLALETGVKPLTEEDTTRLRRLLGMAEQWLETSSRGNAEDYVRHDEVEDIRKRVAALVG
ncbi:hypothetical protein N8J89_31185 [Crossiella sp. CA-258035]|uniref:hypothetical protein n=1 Tax=Crossiella sp. CA-258035 TaxID=2981138 RepID=UPI0024BC4069|nr:hypothetical protein [Crossiella sp. CA-258035]WHT17560.1 hypothetical protein N8J89_31185 [Crossiella sp. CA-258035]